MTLQPFQNKGQETKHHSKRYFTGLMSQNAPSFEPETEQNKTYISFILGHLSHLLRFYLLARLLGDLFVQDLVSSFK